jgi:hypothetical protein
LLLFVWGVIATDLSTGYRPAIGISRSAAVLFAKTLRDLPRPIPI